jgi:hypothetical protein
MTCHLTLTTTLDAEDLCSPSGDEERNPQRLRFDAERCFRLAQGPASRRLADELEAIGRALEHEAREIESDAPPEEE